MLHVVWKFVKMSQFDFLILAFSFNFCRIKIDLSHCLTKASFFKKSLQWTIFGILITFDHSKFKRSSLRLQRWMRLFIGFSNIVFSSNGKIVCPSNFCNAKCIFFAYLWSLIQCIWKLTKVWIWCNFVSLSKKRDYCETISR